VAILLLGVRGIGEFVNSFGCITVSFSRIVFLKGDILLTLVLQSQTRLSRSLIFLLHLNRRIENSGCMLALLWKVESQRSFSLLYILRIKF
jgi:hypothetical protein